MADIPDFDPPLLAELPDEPIRWHQQALVYYPGDGTPIVIHPEMDAADLQSYLGSDFGVEVLRLRLVDALALIS